MATDTEYERLVHQVQAFMHERNAARELQLAAEQMLAFERVRGVITEGANKRLSQERDEAREQLKLADATVEVLRARLEAVEAAVREVAP